MNAHAQVQLAEAINRHDHIRGPRTAITLVEYGDFECPSCGEAHWLVQAIEQEMRHRIRFAFRHFPLINIHPHAEHASEAAEVAGSLGQFWEMHDMLFENQQELGDDDLSAYATALGFDGASFLNEVISGAYARYIQEDIASGIRSEVAGTPTFYINGWRYDGELDLETMLATIESAQLQA
jgi:protein-disulfide isomerase